MWGQASDDTRQRWRAWGSACMMTGSDRDSGGGSSSSGSILTSGGAHPAVADPLCTTIQVPVVGKRRPRPPHDHDDDDDDGGGGALLDAALSPLDVNLAQEGLCGPVELWSAALVDHPRAIKVTLNGNAITSIAPLPPSSSSVTDLGAGAAAMAVAWQQACVQVANSGEVSTETVRMLLNVQGQGGFYEEPEELERLRRAVTSSVRISNQLRSYPLDSDEQPLTIFRRG